MKGVNKMHAMIYLHDFKNINRVLTGYSPTREELQEGEFEMAYIFKDIDESKEDREILDAIFSVLNTNHPIDYNNRSLSVGDVVLLIRHNDTEATTATYYSVAPIGFNQFQHDVLSTNVPKLDQEVLIIDQNNVHELRVRCLQVLGYHDMHVKGEVISIDLKDVGHLIQAGVVEVVVNPYGYNTEDDEYDGLNEIPDDMFPS